MVHDLESFLSTRRPTRTIAFTSGKGGVGTSIIALNTAILLRRLGKKVLLIDGSFALGNIHILLGQTVRWDIRYVINGERKLSEIVMAGPGGIQIIPAAPGDPEITDLGEEDLRDFCSQLELLKEGFDFILIDTGPGIHFLVGQMLCQADEAIVVMRPEPTSLVDSYALIKAMIRVNPSYPFHLLMNMARDARQAKQVFHSIERALIRSYGYRPGNAGFVTFDQKVPFSVVLQVPLVDLAPDSPATKCLWVLARILTGAGEEKKPKRFITFRKNLSAWFSARVKGNSAL